MDIATELEQHAGEELAAGLEVYVVNAAHARNLPARKTDMKDCQWLAELHSKQMLNCGFIPPAAIRELRDYTRLRQDHIQMASPHVLHMQKALDQMNLKIHEVLSELTGASGLRRVEALVAGERNPEVLRGLCDGQVLKHKRPQMLAALKVAGRNRNSLRYARPTKTGSTTRSKSPRVTNGSQRILASGTALDPEVGSPARACCH